MTLYAIFDPQPGKALLPKPVAEQFSWLAALLPPVFLLLRGLWLETLAWLLGVAALVVLASFIGSAAALLLYGLGSIWLGLAAPGLRRHALRWRGWTYRGERIAASPDLAQLEALR
ncbi:MAG: hypothetical protein JWP99_395 [Devosia sp.]|nr:hypothetical protein [Devosia sp.]